MARTFFRRGIQKRFSKQHRDQRSGLSRDRRLRLEPLERRDMLAITVNTLLDVNDPNDGLTTLREAIASAALGETIDFSVTGTINLSSLGELVINKSLTITGPGAESLTIRAFDPTPTQNNGDGSRVFRIDDGNLAIGSAVTISGVTMTGGDINGDGGGIYTLEALTLIDCNVTDNHARNGSGGGILASIFGLSIQTSTISQNIASSGGGIYYRSGSGLTISGSSVDNNQATDGDGGGVRDDTSQVLDITQSTFSNNYATGFGGGVYSSADSGFMTHVTISSNQSDLRGGGIYNSRTAITFRNVTITNNKSAIGAGIEAESVTRLFNSIVSGNTLLDGITPSNISGTAALSGSFNLIGTNGNGGLLPTAGNLLNVDNPLLGPLQDNGGPTATHMPDAMSATVDAGNPNDIFQASVFDQRGSGYPRVLNGRIDIGSVETAGEVIEPPPPIDLSLLVPNLDFEQYNNLPTNHSQMSFPGETVIGWQQLSDTTTDYRNTDGYMGATGVGTTGIASPPPNGSKGFIGVLTLDSPWFEYALNETLPESLIPGNRYQLDLFAGTTTAGGFGSAGGGAFDGELVIYGILDKSLVPTTGNKRIEELPALQSAYVELLAVPVNLAASTWVALPDQSFIPLVPIEAIVFGARRYTTGSYLLIDAAQSPVPPDPAGDYSRNGVVDALDYVLWRMSFGDNVPRYSGADGNGNEVIDEPDYAVWAARYGNVSSSGSATSQYSEHSACYQSASGEFQLPLRQTSSLATDVAFLEVGASHQQPARSTRLLNRSLLPEAVRQDLLTVLQGRGQQSGDFDDLNPLQESVSKKDGIDSALSESFESYLDGERNREPLIDSTR